MTYRKFRLEKKYKEGLTVSERKVLRTLEDVVKTADAVYQKQLKDGFYPKGTNKKDIEKAAREDPEILSPFTYVSRLDKQFVAIPYHELYAKFLEPIAKKIRDAAKICENPSFKKYLLARAKSLLNGSYGEAEIAWLNVKNSKIDFSIGPFERYLDKILFIKRAFQAHIGILDQDKTKFAEKIKEVLYSSAELNPNTLHSTHIPQKGVSVLWEQTPATSGYASEVVFSAEHFPSDLELMEKFGSKIIIYQSHFKLKFEKLYYPIFKTIFEKRFASKHSKESLYNAVGLNVISYELSKQLHKFSGARERLQEVFAPIDEANGFASGIQHCKYLLVKGLISQDELEAIMIIHILWMFADWLVYTKNKAKENHVIGNSILLNAYLKTGALRISGGISWPNFPKIFFEIEDMSTKLVDLLQKGSYKDAEKFIRKNANLKNFEIFGRSLRNINPYL